MIPAFDHAVLLVHDLDRAAADFADLGFTVQSRADADPSHGSTVFRFITFPDGSYILLTAFAGPEARRTHRLAPVLDHGEGWADYSFTVEDAGRTGGALSAGGYATRGPVRVANVLVTGQEWALDLLMCGRGAGGDSAMPFVVSDVAGRTHRIPTPVEHANGATGIAAVQVVTADPSTVSGGLVKLGGKAIPENPQRIAFAGCLVDVLDLGARVGAPPGGGMVGLVLSGVRNLDFNSALTHGARISIQAGAGVAA